MENYKIYLRQIARVIIILVVLLFIWHVGKDWLRPKIINALGGFTKRELKETIDTIGVKIDTVYFPIKEREVEAISSKPSITSTELLTPSFKGKRQYHVLDSIRKVAPKTPIFTYSQAVSDSLIDGVINTTSTGKILSQSLNYKPKFPMFVEKTITVEKTIQETLSNKDRIYFGVGITGTSDKNIGGLLIYQSKNKTQIQVGYLKNLDNIVLNTNTKQGVVSLSLIKLF